MNGMTTGNPPAPDELLVLGSASAEAMPAVFCNCHFCQRAAAAGGRNVRTRTAFALGRTIRIDWGPDALAQNRHFGLDANGLRHVFITHSHEDHLFPMDVWVRSVMTLPHDAVMRLYGNDRVLDAVGAAIGGDWPKARIIPVSMRPGDEVFLDGEALAVQALAASHVDSEQALMFRFTCDRYRLLLTGDTGPFSEETMQALSGARLSTMLIDSTWVMEDREEGHLGLPGVARIVAALRKSSALQSDALIVPVHLGTGRGALIHDDLARRLEPLGMHPAWDGMRIDLATNRIHP